VIFPGNWFMSAVPVADNFARGAKWINGRGKRSKPVDETAPVKGRYHRVSVVYLCNNTSGREQGG
jgi:hypothetical protein